MLADYLPRKFRLAPLGDKCATTWARLITKPLCARQRQIQDARSGSKQAAADSKPTCHVPWKPRPLPPAQILPHMVFARGTRTRGPEYELRPIVRMFPGSAEEPAAAR